MDVWTTQHTKRQNIFSNQIMKDVPSKECFNCSIEIRMLLRPLLRSCPTFGVLCVARLINSVKKYIVRAHIGDTRSHQYLITLEIWKY